MCESLLGNNEKVEELFTLGKENIAIYMDKLGSEYDETIKQFLEEYSTARDSGDEYGKEKYEIFHKVFVAVV